MNHLVVVLACVLAEQPPYGISQIADGLRRKSLRGQERPNKPGTDSSLFILTQQVLYTFVGMSAKDPVFVSVFPNIASKKMI